MTHHRLDPRRSTTVLATGLMVAATALSGCGMVSVGSASASSSGPVAGAAPSSSDQPSADTPSADTPSADPTTSEPTEATPAVPSDTATATPTTKPTTKPAPAPTTPKPTTKPAPTPTAPKPQPVPTEGDTLHVGDSGPYVKSVQQRLSSLGYWNGTADGEFGLLTSQAVMALQKAAGLGRDGVYGPSTRKALQAGTRPQSRIGGTGIEIDKARQLLLVVRGGRVTTILNTSTGSGETYTSRGSQHVANTPAGTFSTFRSVDHLDKGPLGDLWRPRYFNGGIAVHGAASIPGYPASHGCARVSNPAMNMIWADNLMPIGSRVVVY
ncbi:L,D-transpeptidase family protein [Phycicoccus sp. Root563]|uniref:L,D-transpeptidase family protein n=1 Tax=Phycicoccus sp. Root563 TaxID=1736562 RepID=UPI000B2FAF01|nr:L,D-transpeptidase family protein [Phycicoccus sp. Root563]